MLEPLPLPGCLVGPQWDRVCLILLRLDVPGLGASLRRRGGKGGRICEGGCYEQNAKRIKVNKLLRKNHLQTHKRLTKLFSISYLKNMYLIDSVMFFEV